MSHQDQALEIDVGVGAGRPVAGGEPGGVEAPFVLPGHQEHRRPGVLGSIVRAQGPPVVAAHAAEQVGQDGLPGPTVDTEPEHVMGGGGKPPQSPLILGEPGDASLGT